MRNACLFVMTALVFLAACPTVAEVPSLISYQGRLTNEFGNPLEGTHDLRFSLYEDEAGTVTLWIEDHPAHPIANGLFEVLLGDITPFPEDLFHGPVRFLGISVDASPQPSTPLIPIISVPYAFRSNISSLANSLGDLGATPGQVLKWDGTNWIPAEDLTGSPLWQSTGHILKPTSPDDTVDLGPYAHGMTGPQLHHGKLNISTGETALRIQRTYTGADNYSPALQIISDSGWCFYSHAGDERRSWSNINAAVMASAAGDRAVAGCFLGDSPAHGALCCYNFSPGPALQADVPDSNGFSAKFSGGRGLRTESDRVRTAHFEAIESEATADAIVAVDYSGGSDQLADHIGVESACRVADFWGVGGRFEGGYIGARGIVNASGSELYYGISGLANSTANAGCYGVHGSASSNDQSCGVYGEATGGSQAIGIFGTAFGATNNYAGYFDGDVHVTGTITKSSSLTRTDHPLDPDNKYLQTASIESPEMLNVYSGNITTDPTGYTTVTLPDYVEACNTDFRYQLTVIGDFAQAIIAEKIANNQFTIRTDKPNIEVSWQITGLRNDLYAQAHPIEAEPLKSADDRGKYVHPELFGRSTDARIGPPLPDETELAEKNRKIDEAAHSTAVGKQPFNLPVQRVDR